ncbi:hypothetical protein PV04_03975 [Phialophora macrospora]|uniref:Uncharacterized protein n=1 Tax=Phialophora macrospora TaxID=1851006 RepID=A0A0D2G803_9EURO|nr:hypothetical protein PV04_03975 [Phialophora macrospora]
MAEPRRSGRQRKVTSKYANAGWTKETLRRLRESSESSGSSPPESQPSSDSEDDGVPDVGLTLDHGEDDDSMVSAASNGPSDVDSPQEDEEDISIASDEAGSSRPSKPRPFSAPTSETARSRGIQFPRDFAKAAAYPGIFGPAVEDLFDVLRARDTWLRARDITLPSRQTLLTALTQSNELRETTGEQPIGSQAQRRGPSSASSLCDSLRARQALVPIGEAELREKYLVPGSPSHPIVLGPWAKQKRYNLGYLSTMDYGKAWPIEDKQRSTGTAQNAELPSEDTYHQGWLLNIGDKVQCLAWAPCPGPVQYLAVTVRCTSKQRRMAHGSESERPAFHPSPPYPSSIQIWAFDTAELGCKGIRTLDMTREPKLVVVLATNWGNIRRLKWCPLDSDSGGSVIGLLGTVSSDGHARVVAVPLPPDDPTEVHTSTYRIERSGLDIPPHCDTIFTSLTFAGASDLLLGTANGYINLYDLSEETNPNQAPTSYMHQQLHHTYIISICSALDPHSTLVASTSASGDLVLTDLRSPDHDRVVVPRTCFPNRDLVYMPFTRSFIAVLDRSGNGQVERNAATLVACHHIRQFPSLLKVAKLPHWSGAATALAGSHWHPCILVGNAKGQVLATNYLRKILPYRRTDHRKAVGPYMQKICEYDWRPLTEEEQGGQGQEKEEEEEEQGKEAFDLYHGRDVRPGMSRFHEGFKPEKIEVGNPKPSWKKAKKNKNEETGNGEAVFEEEQAVTTIEWNPNGPCAGIVAMGWGSGIVRVQDLAYDP